MMVWFRCLGEGTSTSTHGPIFHESRSSLHEMIIITDRRLRVNGLIYYEFADVFPPIFISPIEKPPKTETLRV